MSVLVKKKKKYLVRHARFLLLFQQTPKKTRSSSLRRYLSSWNGNCISATSREKAWRHIICWSTSKGNIISLCSNNPVAVFLQLLDAVLGVSCLCSFSERRATCVSYSEGLVYFLLISPLVFRRRATALQPLGLGHKFNLGLKDLVAFSHEVADCDQLNGTRLALPSDGS